MNLDPEGAVMEKQVADAFVKAFYHAFATNRQARYYRGGYQYVPSG